MTWWSDERLVICRTRTRSMINMNPTGVRKAVFNELGVKKPARLNHSNWRDKLIGKEKVS